MVNASHVVLPGSRRRLLPGSRLIGHCNPNQRVELTLKLRRKKELPPLQGRPTAPISRAEAAAAYGASPTDIDRVRAVMKAHGLEVLRDDPATRTVEVAGPIQVLEDVFQVKLFEYEHAGRDYRGRSGVINLPSELEGMVVGVYGLDNRRVIQRRRRLRPLAAHAAAVASPRGFFPAQLADVYSFPAGDGAGQTIGILEFGGGFLPDDLDSYCQTVGVKVPTVNPVSVDHSPTTTDDDAAGEVMLDIEVIAGACPAATQVVYFGSSTFDEKAWIDTLGKAIHDDVNKPFILSISWGAPEDSDAWSDGTLDRVNDAFHEAALLGITVCVASGDDGSADETDVEPGDGSLDGHAHVDFPASSPFVLAVGGTDLRVGPSGSTTERAWKDGNGRRKISQDSTGTGGATGGGVSVHFDRPTFQAGITIPSVNPGAPQGRVVPDVAAHAESDGRTRGYFWVLDGQGSPNGGTSAAAPLWAALITRINAILEKEKGPGKRAGYLTPVLYQAGADGKPVGASACKDITAGDNISAAVGGYRCQPGYDAVTGWGSPIGTRLLDALRAVV
jgi:kumamolisin